MLAEALESAARALREASWDPATRVPGVRAMVDVGADDALNAISHAREALDEHGARLGALAAMGGYPLGRIGEALGLTGTGTAVRLAQTDLLSHIVRGQRVTRRDLAKAYAQLSTSSVTSD